LVIMLESEYMEGSGSASPPYFNYVRSKRGRGRENSSGGKGGEEGGEGGDRRVRGRNRKRNLREASNGEGRIFRVQYSSEGKERYHSLPVHHTHSL
jgi:hypothetical protein